MTVECLAYADFAGTFPLSDNPEHAEKFGYILLEVVGRSTFEFLAFSVVTALWLGTAIEAGLSSAEEDNSRLKRFPEVLMGWGCLLIFVSLIQALDIAVAGSERNGYEGSAWAYRSHLLVEGLSWGFHAVLSLICVLMTLARIVSLSTWPQSEIMTRVHVMTKALLPMILCFLCYATRAIWLLEQFVEMPSTLVTSRSRTDPAWWIGFVWIPTLLPSLMLLYSARKRDVPTIPDDYSGASPLLPTPVPPAEAFLSFRRSIAEDGGDLFSSLFTPLRIATADDNASNVGEDETDDNASNVGEDETSAETSQISADYTPPSISVTDREGEQE
jgi:hypothetical protein